MISESILLLLAHLTRQSATPWSPSGPGSGTSHGSWSSGWWRPANINTHFRINKYILLQTTGNWQKGSSRPRIRQRTHKRSPLSHNSLSLFLQVWHLAWSKSAVWNFASKQWMDKFQQYCMIFTKKKENIEKTIHLHNVECAEVFVRNNSQPFGLAVVNLSRRILPHG